MGHWKSRCALLPAELYEKARIDAEQIGLVEMMALQVAVTLILATTTC